MRPSLRIALMQIRLVLRTKAALFFTFLFPLIFLLVYAGLFARGNTEAVVYMFGPVVTLNIMGSGFWGLGLQSVMQRERGSLRRYRLAPIGAGSMVLSSLIANYLLELPTLALLVVCAVGFFHMPLRINPFTLLFLVTVGTFAFAGFGLTIASVANTMQEAQVYNNVAWLTLLFLSGVTVPLPLLPHWIQRVAAFLPSTYLVSSFQAIMVDGHSLLEYRAEMLVLIISGTFGLLFAWKLFRWEKEERISTRNKWLALSFVLPFLLMGAWMNERGSLAGEWKESFSLMSRSPGEAEETPPAAVVEEGRLLADFKDTDEGDDPMKAWRVSAETAAAAHSFGDVGLTAPGADGTGHALRFEGRVEAAPGSDRGAVTLRYAFSLPPGFSTLRGIRMEVRGSARMFQLKLTPPDASLAAPSLNFIPDAQWQTVRLPAAGLVSTNAPSGRNTWTIEVRADGPPGNFQLDLDEVRCY